MFSISDAFIKGKGKLKMLLLCSLDITLKTQYSFNCIDPLEILT